MHNVWIMANPIGSTWLKHKLDLHQHQLTHNSYQGSRPKIQFEENGSATEFYAPHYVPEETLTAHLEFAIKYDDLNFDFLKQVFVNIPFEEIDTYIQRNPRGVSERRIGYLFEFLTNRKLTPRGNTSANYIDLIDNEKYIVGKIQKNRPWLINDNLLGTQKFCPVIRKSNILSATLEQDYKGQIEEIKNSFPPEIYRRAVDYLFAKETRSSYQIEREKPSMERIDRFITLLQKAGSQPFSTLLSESNLTQLQNEIVDPRYAVTGYRNFQNYIGQTWPDYTQLIHYICPPPEIINSIMDGLLETANKLELISPITRAAIISFGFVFAHPFEDGNGRIHRFLIHDLLTRDQVVPEGMIIPVSAHMVNHIKEYDAILEQFSGPLMKKVKYDMKDDQSLVVTNQDEVESYFRYPDLTSQVLYLGRIILATIKNDMQTEIEFLLKYDETKSVIQTIVDMPGKDTDMMIKLLHQNRGTLAGKKREMFAKLTDQEIKQMEEAFKQIFNIPK